jgi:hypothetical protein
MPKMRKLRMDEVSGVDYPAHLHNGFSVVKSVDNHKAAAFMRAAGKEFAMPTKATAKSLAEASPDEIAEVAKALTPEQLQPIIEAVNSVVEDAIKGGGDGTDGGDTPPAKPKPPAPGTDVQAEKELDGSEGGDGGAATDAPDTGEEDEEDEDQKLFKALGGNQAAVAIVKSFQAQVQKAQRDAAEAKRVSEVEKALRLDTQAIQKSRDAYPHLGIDHATVAPAVRKFKDADPKTGAVIENLLKSLEGQAESAQLFKELGTPGGGMETDAYQKVEALAADIMKEEGVTKAVAINKALERQPELFTEYRKGN